MSIDVFDNQVRRGELAPVMPDRDAIEPMLARARARLADAGHQGISGYTRQDSAYDAIFSLALAALALKGYRATQKPGHRARVFDLLPLTADLPPGEAGNYRRVHQLRNQSEYETAVEMNPREIAIVVGYGARLLGLVEVKWAAFTSRVQD